MLGKINANLVYFLMGILLLSACAESAMDTTGVAPNASMAPNPNDAPQLTRAPQVDILHFEGFVDPQSGDFDISIVTPDVDMDTERDDITTINQAMWCSMDGFADGIPGIGPPDTVELVTEAGTISVDPGACADIGATLYGGDDWPDTSLYSILGVLCANVTLRSFYSVEFTNVYAEITYHSGTNGQHGYNGIPTSSGGNGGTGAQDPGVGRWFPTSANGGLWWYDTLGGVLSGDNAATAQWTFQLTDTTPFFFAGIMRAETEEVCGNGTDDDCDDVVDNGCEVFEDGSGCFEDWDCVNGYCEGADLALDIAGSCAEATCEDGIMNADESDIDCGGSACPACIGGDCTGEPGHMTCTYNGPDIDVADGFFDGNISDSTACATITVPQTGYDVADSVGIEMVVDHTWVGDLSFQVISPSGATMTLMNRPGVDDSPFGNGADLMVEHSTWFDESFDVSSEDMGSGLGTTDAVCLADGVCDFAPSSEELTWTGTLVDAVGTDIVGDWVVCVGDSAFGNDGVLGNGTSITFDSSPIIDISITDSGFSPAEVDVDCGASVRWTNNGAMDHTVTTAEIDFGGGLIIDSGAIASGDEWSFTFSECGMTFSYMCSFHTFMTGTVNVGE